MEKKVRDKRYNYCSVPELPDPIQKILASLGFSSKTASRYRFGGIVGKITLIALFGFSAIVGVAKYVPGAALQITAIVVVGIVLLIIVRWILDYAEKHPQSATLEGAEVIVWQQQQQQILMAAKGLTVPPDAPHISSPFVTSEIEPGETS